MKIIDFRSYVATFSEYKRRCIVNFGCTRNVLFGEDNRGEGN